MNVHIRKAEKGDEKLLAAMETICQLGTWRESSYDSEIKNVLSTYVIAEIDEKQIGFAGDWCVAEEAQIMRVGVIPEYRQNGIGKKLVVALMNDALNKGCDTVTLEVKSQNKAAITLYERCGFQIVGKRLSYYADGSDALLMTCDLKDEKKEDTL